MYNLMEKCNSAKSSTSSPSVSDRYIRSGHKNTYIMKKISGKGVMGRIKIYDEPKSQPHFNNKMMTTHQIVQRANDEADRLNTQPRRNFQVINMFEVKRAYFQPMPQLLDWGADDLVVIAANQGVQIANLDKYYEFKRLRSGANATAVKFHKQGLVAGVASSIGQLHILDVDKQQFLRTISSNQHMTSSISSLVWDKNIVINSSDMSIVADDISVKKSMIFNIKRHRFTKITTTSFHQFKLAVGYQNGCVSVFDLRTQKLIEQKNLEETGRNFIQWCPWRTSQLACGINNSLFTFFGDNLATKAVCNTPAKITGLSVIAPYKEIAVAYNNVIDLKTHQFQNIKKLSSHSSNLIHLNFRDKQKLICGVDSNREGYSWNLESTFYQVQKKRPKKSSRMKIR